MKYRRIKYAASAAICVCLMMMAITDNSVFLYAALGISTLFIFCPEVVFTAYFIASLSGGYFSVGTLGASRILSILVILSLLLQCRKSVKPSQSNSVLWLLIIVYSALSCAFSVTGEISPFLIMFQCLLVAFFLKQAVGVDTELLMHLIILSAFISIIMLGRHIMQDSTIMFEERYTGTEGLNTNKFAMMCAQLGAVMIGAFSFLNNRPLKVLCLTSFALSVVIIVLTGSRSALIGLMAAALFVVFITQIQGFRKASLPIVLIILVGVILIRYFSSIDSPIIDRFSIEAVSSSGGTGRMGYAQRILNEVVLVHPLFGVGMGGENVMALGIPKQAHNIIIDPISQLGIIGFSIYLCYVLPIIISSFKIRRKSSFIIIPLTLFIAGLFNGVGEVVFYEKFFWNAIALCGLVCTQAKAPKYSQSNSGM